MLWAPIQLQILILTRIHSTNMNKNNKLPPKYFLLNDYNRYANVYLTVENNSRAQ